MPESPTHAIEEEGSAGQFLTCVGGGYKAGIPEELSNDVLDVVDSDSLDEAAGKLAEKCGVPKEALTFAAQYIY